MTEAGKIVDKIVDAVLNKTIPEFPRQKDDWHVLMIELICDHIIHYYRVPVDRRELKEVVSRVSDCVSELFRSSRNHYRVVAKIVLEVLIGGQVDGLVRSQLWKYYVRAGVSTCYDVARRFLRGDGD